MISTDENSIRPMPVLCFLCKIDITRADAFTGADPWFLPRTIREDVTLVPLRSYIKIEGETIVTYLKGTTKYLFLGNEHTRTSSSHSFHPLCSFQASKLGAPESGAIMSLHQPSHYLYGGLLPYSERSHIGLVNKNLESLKSLYGFEWD